MNEHSRLALDQGLVDERSANLFEFSKGSSNVHDFFYNGSLLCERPFGAPPPYVLHIPLIFPHPVFKKRLWGIPRVHQLTVPDFKQGGFPREINLLRGMEGP
jgi:hypothetical protein